jgi:hypothetical protein
MSDPLYLYFLPDQQEPIRSPYPPQSTSNLFPPGTQCLDTQRGRVWEWSNNINDPGFFQFPVGHVPNPYPRLRAHALLLGLHI